MLSVTNLAGQTEPLNQIQRFEMNEEVKGAFTVSLTSFLITNNPAHPLIEEESIITVDGYDFRIKQLKESLNRKDVSAISTFYDLAGHRQETIYGGTRTLNEFATFILSDTGWTFTSDISESAFIPNFGEDNVIKLIQALCQCFDCEFKILPNKQVHFAKYIGPDNDAQYRYGHNVQALSKSVDTTSMRTQITGYGGGGLKVTYTSPYAEKYGVIEADPIHDDKFTVADDLLEHLKRELNDYPEVTIELDSVELTQKELGERVWLLYEPMGIEFQTRIMAKKSVMRNGKLVTASATIGNAVPRNLSDILASQKVEIDLNAKQTKSRFEQTNEKIVLAVERFDGELLEAYAKIELTADEIRSEVAANNVIVEEGIAQNKSLISQTATAIRSEVSTEITRVDGRINTANSSITQTANSIRSEVSTSVTRLDGRVDTANSSINQLSNQISFKADSSTVTNLGTRVNSVEINMDAVAGQISQKVNATDFNGITIGSLINQSAYNVSISAQAIDLFGITNVANYLTLGTGFGSDTGIYFKGAAVSISTYGDTLRLSAPDIQLDGRVMGLNAPRLALSHQDGTTMEFTGTTMIVRTPSGSVLTFKAV